jgi:hypothetical protein
MHNFENIIYSDSFLTHHFESGVSRGIVFEKSSLLAGTKFLMDVLVPKRANFH